MNKKYSIMCIILFALLCFVGCSNNNKNVMSEKQEKDSKLKVAVSFNPLREFTEYIGKDKVQVEVIVPDGTEPHDFEPKGKDLIVLNNAKVFVYNGLGMESWIDKTLENVDNKDLIVVDASKGCSPIKATEEEKNEQGGYDPHIWLGLSTAIVEGANIKDALVKADPANKQFYEKNYNDFKNKLEVLLKDYKGKFAALNNKSFVTGHAAFAYFCRDFGLKQNSVEGVFGEGEPTPKKMKDLVDYCKSNNVKTIFVEQMVSPKVSETLAKEVNAKVKTIYTIEAKEDNKNYIKSMEENIKGVYESLK
ncbi:metal ABC transporter substrate-binding protein [Clostridium lundense]|uniref:metal ABC transporter substrate-binding protein n=1 Tax=Clostridium lundense TaxID=319475 RepID=UPI0004809FEF|nr:metal ABC transporter substrate-binding protein [Clostridium lundense]